MHAFQTKHGAQSTKHKPRLLARLGFELCLGFVLFGLWAVPVKQAWADPHAVYYTATAQQQLFFNVLAALNQADYVELSGLSSTISPDTRSALLNLRNVASDTGAQQALEQTQTDLSSLITRPVTLEGYDLYTDYLVRQLAGEKQRIVSGEELAAVACERVFGRPGCKEAAQTGSDADKKKQQDAVDKAFIEDPLAWSAWPVMYGAAPALLSGVPEVEAVRQQLLLDGTVPFAYSRDLAYLRQVLVEAGDPQSLELLAQLNYMAEGMVADMLGLSGQNIFAAAVRPDLATQASGQQDVLAQMRQTIVNSNLPQAMYSIAQAASERVLAQQALIQVDGSRANVRVVSDLEQDPDEELYRALRGIPADANLPTGPGELSLELTGPPALRRAELDAAVGSFHEIDAAQQFANPEALVYHGEDDLSPFQGEVAGATSGQVLAARTPAGTEAAPLDVHQKPAHAQGLYAQLLALIINEPHLREAATLPRCGFSGCNDNSAPQNNFAPPQDNPGNPNGLPPDPNL